MKLTGKEKAAVFILSLPDDDAKKIMEGMSEDEIREISRTIARLGQMDEETVKAVREEFLSLFENQSFNVRGGMQKVKDLIFKVLGKEKGRHLLKELQQGPKNTPWEILNEMEPTLVATFLANEHPQSIALIISQLNAEQASFIIDYLAPEVQQEVIYRMAKLGNLPPGALEDIEESLLAELEAMGASRGLYTSEGGGGVKKVAELLNLMPRDTSDKLLAFLDEEDNPLAEDVRKEMFLFEDLLLMDDKSFQTLLREVSNDELLTALKGTDDRLKEKFFTNMSERAAEMLREDLEMMGPVKVSDVEQAQQAILKVARQLEADGAIVIMGKGSDDVVL
ncbi:flagellar motor switch protein FliG [Magnetococcus marinus MC-1]|uniref:Flagellar motor switch protein FliG n=1 Tax=Magnetococcus marinus (strain ATCC BAA-1437 / JCM 17883 / MC-1) TaxID=156889 RepID=A0L4A4_MAGMM|nr:flagellar motor switch protein FliG [Magnetococcus marinus]ABK42797.1 flagellar motor switch protein FliG [Magnetococcus marinus MC-1]